MEKVERLISIIMVLLRKQIVSASEFARLYGVSKRTILRDMETLGLSNIPIYSVTGSKGGFGIMDEYKMDKRLLSSSDLEHILTALGGLEKILFGEEVTLTIRKIESMVRSPVPEGSVQLSFYDWEGRSELRGMLKTCQDAISGKRILAFDYIDKNGAATHRTVEPTGLHFNESSWYLNGFCLDRMDGRLFKLSRIDRLNAEGGTFFPREKTPKEQSRNVYRPELITVKALISPSIRDRFVERYGRKSVTPYDDRFLCASFELPNNWIGFQFLAGFGTQLKIAEPEEYAADFREYLKDMLNAYL